MKNILFAFLLLFSFFALAGDDCVHISVEACTEKKASLNAAVSSFQSEIEGITADLENASASYSSILIEGDQFQYTSSTSVIPGDTAKEKIQNMNALAQSPFYDVSNNPAIMLWEANSIYNYYQSIKPVLLQADASISDAYSSLSSVNDDLDNVSDVVNSYDCSSCPCNNGGNDGGDTPSGGGGDCPCASAIAALESHLSTIRVQLDDIKSVLDNLKTSLNTIQSDVALIRASVVRIDDYISDDFKDLFEKLQKHVLTLSNSCFNVSLSNGLAQVDYPSILYWSDYTNATQTLDAQGKDLDWIETASKINNRGEGGYIDFGEYKTLNWFQRVEFLLGSMVGIFSPSNDLSSTDFSEQEKQAANDAGISVDSAFTFLESPKTKLEQMLSTFDSVKDLLNPFSGTFQPHGSTYLTLLPEVSVESELLKNTFPQITFQLDHSGDGSFSINSIVNFCHTFTTFLWYVVFFLIDVFAIVKFVKGLIFIHAWYFKIYNSWFRTTLY